MKKSWPCLDLHVAHLSISANVNMFCGTFVIRPVKANAKASTIHAFILRSAFTRDCFSQACQVFFSKKKGKKRCISLGETLKFPSMHQLNRTSRHIATFDVVSTVSNWLKMFVVVDVCDSSANLSIYYLINENAVSIQPKHAADKSREKSRVADYKVLWRKKYQIQNQKKVICNTGRTLKHKNNTAIQEESTTQHTILSKYMAIQKNYKVVFESRAVAFAFCQNMYVLMTLALVSQAQHTCMYLLSSLSADTLVVEMSL